MEQNSNFQSVSLEEYAPQMWACVHCFCGMCIHYCPAYNQVKNEIIGLRGLAQVGVAVLNDELKTSDLSDEVIYACTGCGYCESACSQNQPLYIQEHGTRKTIISGATITECLRAIRAENGKIPEVLKDTLDNIGRVGNPYGLSKEDKDKWVEDLGCKFNGEDTLLYVGSMVPYEARSTKSAEALIEVLKKAGVRFAMLGSAESDSAALARYMGEEGLFEEQIEDNSKLIKENGVKQIICLSPHDYDVFLNYYELDGVNVRHYTEVILELIKDGKIKLNKKVNKKVTYQDPCYLGRRNNIYDPPREILKGIPGLELIEMDQSKDLAYCCGGGGTGLWYELPRIHMNHTRVDHAKEKDPDCLVVACPACLQMLDDGVKSRNYDFQVNDLAQIVLEAF